MDEGEYIIHLVLRQDWPISNNEIILKVFNTEDEALDYQDKITGDEGEYSRHHIFTESMELNKARKLYLREKNK